MIWLILYTLFKWGEDFPFYLLYGIIMALVGDKMKRKKVYSKKRKVIDTIILVVAICVFCYAGYQLFLIYKANFDEKQETDKIRELVKVPENELDTFRVDFNELQKINEDVVAWIVVEDTDISYPVVQAKDNTYYLDHTFEKKSNYAGSIFMDYSASRDFSDLNTFIYGHNVYHGTMFAELSNYMDKAFFDKHPYVYLYTPTKNYKLQVFSAYIDTAESNSYRMGFVDESDFANYLALVKGKSKYDSGVEVSPQDHIITLYTCSYESGDNPTNTEASEIDDRYYIHTKMIQDLDESNK